MVTSDLESRRRPSAEQMAEVDSVADRGRPWREHHRVLAMADDGLSALALQVGAHPATNLASFACVVFRVGREPIVISETNIELPVARWELRASGLWADHICEHPFVHWSFGLEAFALAIDNPSELLGQGYGQRVPLGWELDFESAADPVTEFGGGPSGQVRSYSQAGRIEGSLLFADGTMNLCGSALRHHWWGRQPDPDARLGSLKAEPSLERSDSPSVALPLPNGVWWVTHNDAGLSSRMLDLDQG